MIGITDHKGKRTVYKIKPVEKVTIADWRALSFPVLPKFEDHTEHLIELIKRHTSIPENVIRKLHVGQMRDLLNAMGDLVLKLNEAQKEANDEAIPVIKYFVHDKVRYEVPQHLENAVTWGQWEDLIKVLIPKAETQADIMAAICASLCMPDGEEYHGPKALVRIKAFETLPITTAFKVHAFFFAKSEQYRNDISRSILLSATSNLPKLALGQTSSSSATATT